MTVRPVLAAVTAALVVSGAALAGQASADQPEHTSVVSAVPTSTTPQVLDGAVYAITQVGDTMVLGGSFTKVGSGSATPYALPYVLAFDAATGAVRTAFAPQLDGAVQTVLPGPTPGTVYVGGAFNTVAGAQAKGLVLLDLATGQRVPGFRMPATNGIVNTVERVGDRLFVGGTFTKVASQDRGGLATLSATTGAVDGYLTTSVLVNHNWTPTSDPRDARAAVGVTRLDVAPDGRTMVAIGNFKTVREAGQTDALSRDQMALWDLAPTGASVKADWRTTRLADACLKRSYDSYVRDVAFSPDGSYFVEVNTGGHREGALCDAASRWETTGTGQDVQPTWVAYTGADSLLSTTITGEAVYVGGHQRWLNNPLGRDAAGPGGVPRPGIAALDPANGVPMAWNPGRNPRGVGAGVLFASETSLWVGSDTDFIGNRQYRRGKVAQFPLAGGRPAASTATPSLPGGVYAGTATGVTGRAFDGTTVGPAQPVTTPLDVEALRGQVVVGGTMFYGKADANLYTRTLRGSTWGPEVLVDPYNDPYWSDVETGTKKNGIPVLYRGTKPGFYAELPKVTSMFYADGRLFYTMTGTTALYSRAFSPDSGIVHPVRVQVPAVSMPAVSGAFLADGTLYYVTSTNGNLNRVAFDGRPVGAATVVSGPAQGGPDWRGRLLYLSTAPGEEPPAPVSPSFRDSSSSASRAAAFDVPLPGRAQVGDALLLKVSTAVTGSAPTAPAGWTEVARRTAGQSLTVLWQRRATAEDLAARSARVQLALATASSSQVLAYAGAAATPVSASATSSDAAQVAAHTAPDVRVDAEGSTVVWFWADKSSSTTAWSLPAGVQRRVEAYGTGAGRLSAVAGDAPGRPVGLVEGPTATTDGASRAAAFAVVLAPAAP